VTKPASTVAAVWLLEAQIAVSVMTTGPLHVVAVAANCAVLGVLEALRLALVGFKVIDWMHPTVTVSDCVPLMDGFCVEVAVTVVVPRLSEVTKPEALIVAKPVGETLHWTGGLPVLPSLYWPVAVICTVLSVLPVSMVGVSGVTVIELSVG